MYKLNAVEPELESAWFHKPPNLSVKVKRTRFLNMLSQRVDLYRYTTVEEKKKPEPKKGTPAKSSTSPTNSLGAALAAKMAGKRWVGQRRTADVVAATKVECLVLGKREMQWWGGAS
jgi:hypothetical protein